LTRVSINLRETLLSKQMDGRVKPGHDEFYLGTTAVASISTRAVFSTSRTTCTSAIAG
jgi:hypothetical protein